MKKMGVIHLIALAFFATILTGCSSTSGSQYSDTSGSRPGSIIGTIPDDSKFAKISIGMSIRQVTDLIGPPTDQKVYTTGKAFIPFYMGSDIVRHESFYKGEGRIIYTGGAGLIGGGVNSVYTIIYDPDESGYAR